MGSALGYLNAGFIATWAAMPTALEAAATVWNGKPNENKGSLTEERPLLPEGNNASP